jgi:ABC-type multidrug transport system ATPase subunit
LRVQKPSNPDDRIGRHERRAAIDWTLDLANLRDRRDTRVDKLSGTMRRRLLIARALVHRPQYCFSTSSRSADS